MKNPWFEPANWKLPFLAQKVEFSQDEEKLRLSCKKYFFFVKAGSGPRPRT
jgi:hypothetical protein